MSFQKSVVLTCLALVAASGVIPCFSAAGDETKKKPDYVMDAFKERMNGRSAKAREILQIAIFIGDDQACCFFEMARLDYYQGEYDKAYYNIMDALAVEPDNPRYLYWKGVITSIRNASLFRVNKRLNPALTAEAVAALKKALKIDPDFHEARFKLIEILVRLQKRDGGDPAAAAALAEELYERDPGWGVLAWAHTIVPGRSWDEVLPRIEKVLEKNPDQIGALLAKAMKLFIEKDLENAVPLVEKIVSLDKSRKVLYLPLAFCCLKDQEWDRGEAWIKKYLDFPGLSVAEKAMGRMQISNLHLAAKNKEASDRIKEEALAIDPQCWQATAMPPSDIFLPPRKR